jgi:hypothetical protein
VLTFKSYDVCKYLFKDSEHFVPRVNELIRRREPFLGGIDGNGRQSLERIYTLFLSTIKIKDIYGNILMSPKFLR